MYYYHRYLLSDQYLGTLLATSFFVVTSLPSFIFAPFKFQGCLKIPQEYAQHNFSEGQPLG